MLSILPAFSSQDLKVFLLPKSLSNLPRAGRAGPLRVPAARLCDLFRSAIAPLHKSHRLAYSRIKVANVVILSVGLCQSRKDRYLPLDVPSVVEQTVALALSGGPSPVFLQAVEQVASFKKAFRRQGIG